MAIYHLHVKVIGRKAGSSAVASAAYRSASRMRDERIDRVQDFSNKRGVVHSEVMLPEHAPEQWSDRERLWNDVEAFEVRKDAQLAREVEFAIPREMTERQGIELARDFAQAEFVDQGMIADVNVHWDMAEDGSPKPHAHVMLTMRSVDENGFGPKVRDWNRTEMVERWRERWAEHVNERLADLDIDARIDHRSLEAQGIGLEPQSQIGAPAQRIETHSVEGDGIEAANVADRAELHREIARNNGARIIADPSVALDAITQQQSTFTRRDMAMFAHRHSDGIEQFNEVMGAMRGSPDLVELGQDGRGAVALRDAARVVLPLNPMGDKEAEELSIADPALRRSLVRIDTGKANRAPPDAATWIKLESQSLDNGEGLEPSDFVGVATLWEKPDVFHGLTTWHLYTVQQRLVAGDWRESVQAKDWVGHLVANVAGLSAETDKGRIKAIIRTWKRNGALAVEHRAINGREVPFVIVGKAVDASEIGSRPHLATCGAESAEGVGADP